MQEKWKEFSEDVTTELIETKEPENDVWAEIQMISGS